MDRNNFANALNYITTLGEYTGGKLEVQQSDGSWMESNTLNRLVHFDHLTGSHQCSTVSGKVWSMSQLVVFKQYLSLYGHLSKHGVLNPVFRQKDRWH
eukprot:6473455-Amphidinium_carterae.1